MTTNKAKLSLMLQMQSDLNAVVNPDWKDAGYNWNLAIADEGMELMNHYGWKWWKAFKPDLPQCRLELVDIFHFLLSKALLQQHFHNISLDNIYSFLATEGLFSDEKYLKKTDPEIVRRQISYLVHVVSSPSAVNPVLGEACFAFASLCHSFDLSFDDIFKLYVQKNTLNIFRQANGYKQGTYVKIWHDGREDNEHLTEICQSIDFNSAKCIEEVHKALTDRYSKNTTAGAQ